VVAADGIDARLVVGAVVSTGETLVHILAALAVSSVTVFTSTLERERAASEGAHGVFVTVVGSNCAARGSLKSGTTQQEDMAFYVCATFFFSYLFKRKIDLVARGYPEMAPKSQKFQF
jgi:hypothetical protein